MYYFLLRPRLQRLYASNITVKEMRWHTEHESEGIMHHNFDTPPCKHFNNTYQSFTSESQNVRLGFCTNGFQMFGQSSHQYSSRPVIVEAEYMFLTIIIPPPKNPKDMLDVYLHPFIPKVKHLLKIGVKTYDASRKNSFQIYILHLCRP